MTISVADYAAECAAQGLRGDYSVCRSDFTVAQGYDYSAEEQAVWRTLCDRQTKLTQKLAHRSYLDGVAALGLLDRIPDFDAVSEKLSKLTGWEIVAVPGLIPAGPF
ncbi:MAG: phenylalanine 4-monooxygenase, partial [Mesorhizobium sp.]